jgi:hypothetical protein
LIFTTIVCRTCNVLNLTSIRVLTNWDTFHGSGALRTLYALTVPILTLTLPLELLLTSHPRVSLTLSVLLVSEVLHLTGGEILAVILNRLDEAQLLGGLIIPHLRDCLQSCNITVWIHNDLVNVRKPEQILRPLLHRSSERVLPADEVKTLLQESLIKIVAESPPRFLTDDLPDSAFCDSHEIAISKRGLNIHLHASWLDNLVPYDRVCESWKPPRVVELDSC